MLNVNMMLILSSASVCSKGCAELDGGKNQVNNVLIPTSVSLENLCQMDPLWYPWL
jgi:hypothetical protein